jgi:hypothetical protein
MKLVSILMVLSISLTFSSCKSVMESKLTQSASEIKLNKDEIDQQLIRNQLEKLELIKFVADLQELLKDHYMKTRNSTGIKMEKKFNLDMFLTEPRGDLLNSGFLSQIFNIIVSLVSGLLNGSIG